jgi:hypothetical protein
MSKKVIDLTGMSRDEAIINLVSVEGMELKAAKKFWKDNRPEPKPSWKKAFYAELAAGKMSESRFEELVELEGGNVEAHKSAHRMVWEMANAIWSS